MIHTRTLDPDFQQDESNSVPERGCLGKERLIRLRRSFPHADRVTNVRSEPDDVSLDGKST